MIRTAKAHWSANLKEGKGKLTTASNILNETNSELLNYRK